MEKMVATARRPNILATCAVLIARSPTIPDRTAAISPTATPETTTTPDPLVVVMEDILTMMMAVKMGTAEGEEEEEDVDVDRIGDRARTYQGFEFQNLSV